MAIFKLGAMFDAISGKVGGQSLCNYSQQQILRNITYTNKTPTPKQSTQRAFTSYLANSWRFLTQAQRDGWDATATNYTYENRVGDTITRNGYQTFCFCNQNLNLIEQSLISTAPAYVPVTEPKINIIDISSGNFEIQSNNASSDYLYALFGIANLSPGEKAQLGKMRFIGYITSAQLTAGYDVISDLESIFGTLSFPNKMAITVDPINQTTGNRKQFIEIIQNVDTPMILELTLSASASVTIPFISGGTYSGSITWGDGTVTTFSAYNSAGCSHTFADGGTYNVVINGQFPQFMVSAGSFANYLSNVFQFGSNIFTNLNFQGCTLLSTVNCSDAPSFTASLTLNNLFFNCTNLTFWNQLNTWDVSLVTSLSSSFRNTLLDQDLSYWDVSNVTQLLGTFRNTVFTTGLSTWVASSCISFTDCFRDGTFNAPIPNLVTSTATGLGSMFRDNTAFNQDLSNWDVSSVTSFANTFRQCSSISQDLSSWDIQSATSMLVFASGCSFTNSQWDNMLIAWAGLATPPSGITISINATHTATANTAYTTLTTTYSWTINEGA